MNDDVPESIQALIRERYAIIARSPSSEKDFPVGRESAKSLGYPTEEIDALPQSVTESFAGVGYPFSLGEIEAGETVLDLGCGSGMDCILAARKVGPQGKVIGVDMTEEMIEKAKENAQALGITNVEFRHGTIEALPVEDGEHRCGDLQWGLQSVSRQARSSYRGVPSPSGWRSAADGRYTAGGPCDARQGATHGFVVWMNCWCGLERVAPLDANGRWIH